jgi:hypothetical protein
MKQSISLNNNNFEGYNYIGKIFGSLNNYKVAKLNFEKALYNSDTNEIREKIKRAL